MTPHVALVTGGASGIGRALGRALARRGHIVVIADIDAPGSADTVVELEALARPLGGRCWALPLDVTDRAAFDAAVQRVQAEHGRIDVLFNNAGIGVAGYAEEFTDEHWDRVIDVNLRGVVHGVQAVLPLMIAQHSGHIVNTASLAGLVTAPRMLPYATTKHAVVALSRALRVEVIDQGVQVLAVCPDFVDTPLLDNLNPGLPATSVSQTAARRLRARPLADPDQLAEAVLRAMARSQALVVHPRRRWGMVAAMRLAPGLIEGLVRRELRQRPSSR